MKHETDPTWRRWEEVDRLLSRALDRPEEDRERFLAGACEADTELFRAVVGLLRALDASDGMFDAPGAGLLHAALGDGEGRANAQPLAFAAGDRVGRYRIVGIIGRGGMATVYEAERADGSFRRRVAIKVLRRGLDTEAVVRRFLAERQILSGLSHPNIARLIDGGATEDGRPYLVMERVEGTPLTRWADRRRLTVEQRLDLFLQLADAVHFAHRRLVVHRDLKPSNVLVDAEGRAHLLDFGIARLLEGGSDGEPLTRIGGPRPLTPGFASPEQLAGEPATTASDVYQLGILLHLLLTGRRPPGAKVERDPRSEPDIRPSRSVGHSSAPTGTGGEAEARSGPDPREVADRRATTVAALRRSLRGDLDTIVRKALRSDPDDRYPSAEALASDVRRFLAGRAIAARPASALYRLGKFHARNPWVGPLAAALLLATGGYVFTLDRHSRELEAERNAARAQAERADELRSFMVGLFRTADPYEAPDPDRSREMTVVEALEVGAGRVRSELDGRPELQAAMLTTIAGVYHNMALEESAGPLIDEAMEIHAVAGAEDTPGYASTLGTLARHTARSEGADSARALMDRWVAREAELAGSDSLRLAGALLERANNAVNRGDFRAGLEGRERAVEIHRSADRVGARGEFAEALAMLADSYREVGRMSRAEAAAREALAIEEALRGPDHPSTAMQRVHLAQVYHATGRLEESVAAYRRALPALERTLGPDHFNTVNSWNNLGLVLSSMRDHEGSERVHRRVLAIRRGPDGAETLDVASSLQNLAAALLRAGRHAEADSLAREAYRIYRDLAPEGSHLPALPLLSQAEIRLAAGDDAGAEAVARSALEILRPALPPGHFATAVAECRIGMALARQGRPQPAAPLIERARDALHRWEGTPQRLVEECDAGGEQLAERPVGR